MSGKGFVLLCQHHSFFAVNGISVPYPNNMDCICRKNVV